MKKIMFAALVVAAFPSLAGCSSDDDSGSHRGQYVGPTVAEKMYYTVELNDPNVLEAADLLVRYLDADGTIRQDTVRSGLWRKPVLFKTGKNVFFTLAAHYFAKESPTLTKDSYDFGIDIASPLFYMDEKGDSLFVGSITPQKKDGSGLFYIGKTKLSKTEIMSEQGRSDIDTTMVFFNTNDSATQTRPYTWTE